MLLFKPCVQPFQASVCFLTLLLSFLSAASTHGQASLLRFEGHVGGVSGDSTLASDSNLYLGQPFNFTVLIDPSRNGTYVNPSGNIQPINAFSDPAYPGFYENAFHVEFIGGNRIWNPGLAGDGYGTANYAEGSASGELDSAGDSPVAPPPHRLEVSMNGPLTMGAEDGPVRPNVPPSPGAAGEASA